MYSDGSGCFSNCSSDPGKKLILKKNLQLKIILAAFKCSDNTNVNKKCYEV